MKTVAMIIDVAKCINCNNCFLADKDEHVDNDWLPYSLTQPKHGHRWIDILTKERGRFPMVDVAHLPTMCNQCRVPACLNQAPAGAVYQRPDGIVIIDPVKAVGHKEIVEACPYGHIWWNEAHQVPQKWTMNVHLLEQGWKEPRCVQACATGAMTFHSLEESELACLVDSEKLEVLHPEYATQPRIYYRNLQRFTHAFIGGSLAIKVVKTENEDEREECAAGILVTLYQRHTKMAETVSDVFGDFKFDGLPEASGTYTVEVTPPHRDKQSLDVSLGSSQHIGLILL
jgi:Fe-S-cluster-containing dehydrogenase component